MLGACPRHAPCRLAIICSTRQRSPVGSRFGEAKACRCRVASGDVGQHSWSFGAVYNLIWHKTPHERPLSLGVLCRPTYADPQREASPGGSHDEQPDSVERLLQLALYSFLTTIYAYFPIGWLAVSFEGDTPSMMTLAAEANARLPEAEKIAVSPHVLQVSTTSAQPPAIRAMPGGYVKPDR